MANTTAAAMMTELTTMEAEEVAFNFIGLWITIGVFSVFVLSFVIYGLVIAQTGKLFLPQRAEDKVPLSPDNRDNDVEAADEKKTSPSTSTGVKETDNATVADEPPSYDKAVLGASSGQDAATNTDAGGGKTADDASVKIEVYEQKVDTADEL